MYEISLSADDLIGALLTLAKTGRVCILDSCGVGHLGSHLLIAGITPIETYQLSFEDPEVTLRIFDKKLSSDDSAAIFTVSYDFGLKLQGIESRLKENKTSAEPDIFLALFDCLIIHDYDTKKSYLTGNRRKFAGLLQQLNEAGPLPEPILPDDNVSSSNFSKAAYLDAINDIKDHIRAGDTYQTNLTQQLSIDLPKDLMSAQIFSRLRKDHPAPFAAFIKRDDSTVISASPERFLSVEGNRVTVSPIKGTRPRGLTAAEDSKLREELLTSEKDRAENTMIVDLMRNDIGQICKYGSVEVEKLCDLEEHPTLFHLVSTVRGELRDKISYADLIRAVFPCGSVTGAPKIRTMQIIDEIETADRGLSMGAIGYRIPDAKFSIPASFDMSVAIRTMVIRKQQAVFNVGGGIVIDSDPDDEYDETLVKAKALLDALNTYIPD